MAFVAAIFPDPFAPRSLVAWRCDLVRARGLAANAAASLSRRHHYTGAARIGASVDELRQRLRRREEPRHHQRVRFDTAAPEVVKELVKAGVDAILTGGVPATATAQRALSQYS